MDTNQAKRYAASFCSICGIRAGAVSNGRTVCNSHIGSSQPTIFDDKTGEPVTSD